MAYPNQRLLKSFFLAIFVSLAASSYSQSTFKTDSLERQLLVQRVDSIRFKVYAALFTELRSYNPSKALLYAKKHLQLAQVCENKKEIAHAYSNIGSINYNLGNYSDGLSNGFKALKIREELGNKEDIATSLSNIGLVYNKQSLFALALKYHQKSLELRKELNNKMGMSISYNNLGLAYMAMENDSLALKNFFKSFELKEELNDARGKAQGLNNIATVYTRQNLYEKALEFLFQSLSIKQELNDQNGIASSYDNIGDVFYKRAEKNNTVRDYNNALNYYLKSLKIARELKLKEVIKVCCESISDVYAKLGNFDLAYSYFKEFTVIKDSLVNEHIARNTAELQSNYESEKQEKTIALLNKDKLIAQSTERTQRTIIIAGILFTVIALGFILNRYFVKQRANNLLTQKNKLIDQNRTELRKQKEIIEQKNRDITDSIDYAKNVQSLILPSEREFKRAFPASFILFRPKSILSGDFFWYHQTENRLLLAVIDCTGHGIPGAMMSFLGYNLLENVVKVKNIEEPEQILKELNKEVFSTLSLKNENLNSKYGMDISLISIHKKTREIYYSGAHQALYLISNGELSEYKGDKFSIGTLYTGPEKEFTKHRIFYKEGDCIYLFTDGFVDQIGGPDRKKFYYAPFKELLSKNSFLKPEEQKIKYESALLAWKGERDQTDDVLLIGVEL